MNENSPTDSKLLFARFLSACRLLLIFPVIGCVMLTAGVVIMGMGRILNGSRILLAGDYSAKAAKQLSLSVIEVIDLFLIGTVAYIAAIGIYKLFISTVEIEMPMRIKINTLKDLEDKILGVLVAALAVAFLGQAAGADTPEALLNYGGGIAVVIAALAFFMRHGDKNS
ncbi:MAG: YqhA family protein [Gammaproteobacteria bacterium]|nr:YqhA family protein [Gammaproteobacteria bacterium]